MHIQFDHLLTNLMLFCRDCYFCVASAMHEIEFVQAINHGFCSGGMFCTLSDVDLGSYLLSKVMEFMRTNRPRTLKAVLNIGQQDSTPPVYILSPKVRYIYYVGGVHCF